MNPINRPALQPGEGGAQAMDKADPLRLYKEAGLEEIWLKGRRLTAYLEHLLETLPDRPFQIITPHEPAQRGNQLSILLKKEAKVAAKALWARGVVIDERPPNLIRVSPTPVYNTYQEAWQFVRHFHDVLLADER